MKIAPGSGALAIAYIGKKLVYVGIGMALRNIFHECLSHITAESFAHIGTVATQLCAQGSQAQVRTTPHALHFEQGSLSGQTVKIPQYGVRLLYFSMIYGV